ncbi:MAG: metallophosphoesterase, partial [Clostridia bacterium]|nr:metallophosphoesterase [Clostridia bacterium]
MPGFHILLCHHPEYWEPLVHGRRIELTVSGHAHGGQWRIFGRGVYAPGQGLFPRYTSGLYRSEDAET